MPHIGFVGAGTTVEFYDHPRASRILRPTWNPDGSMARTVTVEGDSLIGEHIIDGDTLVLKVAEHLAEIRPGRLVIAVLPTGRSVAKRIYFESGQIVLRASNRRYKDMVFEPDLVSIEALVKKVVRDVD